MGGQHLHTDIAIIGGGIAGLWCLNHLRGQGYSALLFEQEALGSYQTIGSQGMIHGGVKYALAGAWSGSSETISAMPAAWRRCLAGDGKVDLSGCRVLSEDFYLWSTATLHSRVSSFFASKMLRGRVERVKPADYPPPLRSAAFRGQVYRLADLVLDVPSLVKTLASRYPESIFSLDWRHASLRMEGRKAVLDLPGCTVVPAQMLLAAGAGNEALMASLDCAAPAMQRRPLQQVLVRHEYEEAFYGHCMGGEPSPRLTISSHHDRSGRPIWYLGGDLSTGAADEAPASLIERARAELDELLPWIDLGRCEWATLKLDRAEPRQSLLQRPDSAFLASLENTDNARVAWPTKLTLCPDLGNELENQLAAQGILPRHQPDLAPLAALSRPPLAIPYWDTLFQ